MNIYVGNLDYKVGENELRDLFIPFGEVKSVKIIKDKFSGRSKGFGFVEMTNETEAANAIRELDGQLLRTRNISVKKALPPKEK